MQAITTKFIPATNTRGSRINDDTRAGDFVERNGRFECRHCGYELSAMISEDEIPQHCDCQL